MSANTLKQDPSTPASRWSQCLAEDSRPVPDYMFRRYPLDLDAAGVDFRVDAKLFTSREAQNEERERLWKTVWQIACRENDVPGNGDYIEYEIAGISILVVRDLTGKIRAFRNACTHRGTAVAGGSGNLRCFVCPYHGWTFALDGSLRKIPGEWDFPHVDKSTQGLKPCLAESFHGWVFINLDVNAMPLREFLGDVYELMPQRPIQRMWKHYHLGMVLNCNWKIMAHTFMEAYHISRTHPQIAAFVGDIYAEVDFIGRHTRQKGGAGTPSVLHGKTYTPQETLEQSIAFNTGRFGDAGTEIDAEVAPVILPDGMPIRQVMADIVRNQMSDSGIDLENVCDAEILDSMPWSIFPNASLLNHAPGQMNFRFRPHGEDPNFCLFEIMALKAVPEDQPLPRDISMVMAKPGELLKDYAEKIGVAGALLDQDIDNAVAEQKGLNSGIEQIVLAQRMESVIAWFQHNLAQWIEQHPAAAS